MKILIRQQTCAANLITNFMTNLRKTAKNKQTKGFLIGRRSLLFQYWEKYVKGYEDLSNAAEDDTTTEAAQQALDAFSETERVYTETLGELNDMIEAATNPPTIPGQQQTATTTPLDVQLSQRLPPIKIPLFDGSFLRWYPFKDLFTSIVIQSRSLSNTQRLQYLKDSLTGEAKNTLDNIATTDANFTVAWELLERKFDNKRIIINAHLNEIMTLTPIRKESAVNLRSLIDKVTATLRALEQLGRPVAHWDDWLIYTIVHKLDAASVRAWELSISSKQTIPSFDDLRQFLENQTKSLEVMQSFADSKPNNVPAKDDAKSRPSGVKGYHTTASNCPCCASKHYILFCTEFRNQTPQQRYKTVQQSKLCSNCLRPNHKSQTCPSTRRCQKCSLAHHTMLHEYYTCSSPNQLRSTAADATQQPITIHNASIAHQTSCDIPPVLLGTALIEVRSDTGHTMVLRALLDSGAEATFISEYAVSQLRLAKSALRIPLNGANGERLTTTTGSVKFTLRSTKSAFEKLCYALVLPRVGNPCPSVSSPPEQFASFWQLDLADPKFHLAGTIDVILSAGDYAAILLSEIKHCPNSGIIAQKTQLGWIIFGRLASQGTPSLKPAYDCYATSIELDELISRFWEQEEVSTHNTLSKDDTLCSKFFESTTQRTETGRYVVRLPVKNESQLSQLASTRGAAISLLNSMERRLHRDDTVRKLYHDFMSEYYLLGHMERAKDDTTSRRVSYLPHHSVLKESSTTTKLRVVFNASKRSESGLSLNDCLYTGPKLQGDLASIVLNWRKYRVAFTADIEKMYRQILVHHDDVDLQRILWRFDDQEPVSTFRLLTVTYGTNCAPFLAMKVLQTLAKDEEHRFPRGSATLRHEFYVDDVLSGGDTIDEANQLRSELQKLLLAGGFKLRKWNSNCQDILGKIDPADREEKGSHELRTETESKALGIVWMTHTDSFSYNIKLSPAERRFTKREFLSDVAKLFDPLGFLSPVLIKGKLLFQNLWQLGIDWDEDLPGTIQSEWGSLRAELETLRNLRIPRWIQTSNNATALEYHAFADASTQAYAAVVYLKVASGLGIHVTLLIAKTKVAPLKRMTIPRLELCAALLASKLMAKVQEVLKLQSVATYFWSDSTTVLGWIRSKPGSLKEFVCNRVTQIHETTSSYQWRYVPTADNPADCATRGISPSQLINHALWWAGPPWLHLSEDQWPNLRPGVPDTLPETKPVKILNTQIVDVSILNKYSDLDKLLAITAWCQRFIDIALGRQHFTAPYCLWTELYAALKSWTKRVQQEAYPQEVRHLRESKSIDKKSKLVSLYPFLDSEGILRVGGRLKNADLSFNERHPMILPKNSNLTILLIKHAHNQLLHAGTQATLNHIRRRFWVINGRDAVKGAIRKCLVCFRQSCKPNTQLMGQLPAPRCNISTPFGHTGVDYAGPFHVRTTKGRGHRAYKGYVAVFICLATKACHLELVSDMTTEAFIAALNRFIATRGLCTDIYSDNGTTFVGANTLLGSERVALQAQLKSAASYTSRREINWHFIPPAAPNFGGLWEAAVKSMKMHLKRVIGSTTLTFEEFYTLLKQIEACLNSRPLTPLTDDPSDLTALTPGHFLIGRALTTSPEACPLNAKMTHVSRWKQLTQMYHDFWIRWSSEYLQGLQARNKWQHQKSKIDVGQLVLVRDERLPPTQWLLGRILDIHPGTDGIARVATVKTKATILKRPITKLSILPIENNIADGGRPVST